jgi:hypothetical protein
MWRRIASIAMAITIGTGLAVGASAGPAAAAWRGPCWEDTLIKKEYDLPNKTDLQVVVVPCVKRDGSKLYAYFTLDWYPMNYPWLGSARKFDSFQIVVNLERRLNGDSTDRVVEQHTCDITSRVNDHNSGIVTCKTPVYNGYSSAYNYSGDGYIRADIDNDGEGADLWFIHGSPLIY